MRSQNIFWASGREYSGFRVPFALFDKLLGENMREKMALPLYALLLRHAQTPTFRLHTSTILDELDVSRPTMRDARDELVAKNLIRFKEVDGAKKGWFNFELLGIGGARLATSEYFIKFSELPEKEIKEYYCDRLGSEAQKDAAGDLVFPCCFCMHSPNKTPLLVNLSGKFRSQYICGACGQRGGFVSLEQWRAKKLGEGELNKRDAARRARYFMLSRRSVETLPVRTKMSPDEALAII